MESAVETKGIKIEVLRSNDTKHGIICQKLGSYIQTESQSKHPFTEEIIIGFQKNNLIQMQKW